MLCGGNEGALVCPAVSDFRAGADLGINWEEQESM